MPFSFYWKPSKRLIVKKNLSSLYLAYLQLWGKSVFFWLVSWDFSLQMRSKYIRKFKVKKIKITKKKVEQLNNLNFFRKAKIIFLFFSLHFWQLYFALHLIKSLNFSSLKREEYNFFKNLTLNLTLIVIFNDGYWTWNSKDEDEVLKKFILIRSFGNHSFHC